MAKYDLYDYLGIDTESLTVEVVQNDEEYVSTHPLVGDYIGLSKVVFRTMKRATDTEKVELWNALTEYVLNNQEADLDDLPPLVASAYDQALDDHMGRIKGKWVGDYKKYVGGKRRAALAKQERDDKERGF